MTNSRRLRRPAPDPPSVRGAVSLLVPARNEADRIAPTLASLLAQRGLDDAEILVYDDESTDDTAGVVRRVAGRRARILKGTALPPDWLGKPHACAQLSAAARGEVLVFVDADVVLAPRAVAAAVALMRGPAPVDLLSPWPRQVAHGVLGHLLQPLLAWSWMTTLPLGVADRSPRPSMGVANGQFLLVDAAALARAGGWRAVGDCVLDDIELARAIRRAGGRTRVVDGSALASCRMYASGAQTARGYRKSLWAAFGSPAGAVAVGALLVVAYVLPAAAALHGSRVGALGYAVAVLGRVATSRFDEAGGVRAAAAAAAQPLSVSALVVLLGASWRGHLRGVLTWKGRTL